MYDGRPLEPGAENVTVINTIAEVLEKYCVIDSKENAMIIHLSEKDLCEMCIRESTKDSDVHVETENEKIASAITFTGTMFAESLKFGIKTGNFGKFAKDLVLNSANSQVAACMKAIATAPAKSIPRSLANRYHINSLAIDTIKDVYASIPNW